MQPTPLTELMLVRRLALLGLCVASTTACSMMPNRDIMFTQLATTAEPSKLQATIVQYGEPGREAWRDVDILRSTAATVDLDAGTLALGHLVSDGGDVGLHAVAVTSNYSFSLDVATGVATIIASSTATVVATFDTPGSAVAWFVSGALGLAYVVHERPSDSEQRVLIAPLGCGASCVVTDTQLGGGNSYFDTMNSMPTTVLVDDAAQVVRLPVPCCICVSHASYRFDEAGMHRRDALDVAFASSAVDTRGAVIHVAGQQWDEVSKPAYLRTFTSATIANHGFGASTNVSTLTFPAATLLALLDRAHTPVAPPPPPPPPSTLPPPPSFACYTKELWSAAKAKWCCDNEQLGCLKCGGTATPVEGSNCGRGGARCGGGFYCDVEPTDKWAVCCPVSPPSTPPPYPPLASLESVVLTMTASGRAAWSKRLPWALPDVGSCASAGRAWWLWVPRHSQGERGRSTGRPATASGARASRLPHRRLLCL